MNDSAWTNADPDAPHTCPTCGGGELSKVVRVPRMPVICNVLHRTREAAMSAPRGDIDLAHCEACGMVFNAAFDPGLMHYDAVYENALHFSAQFREYAERLAQGLVAGFGLQGKRIVELGCGDGSFLSRLCELGGSEGVGFDPAFDPARSAIKPGVSARVVRELYTSKTKLPPPDFVSCRHVLEHITSPRDFLADLRRALPDGAGVYFEVPNCGYMLEQLAIWDIIYEHCNYFTGEALRSLFARAGFEVLGAAGTYGGQFLGLRARAGSPLARAEAPDDRAHALAHAFAREHHTKLVHWRSRLDQWRGAGARVVLWGAGSKGVTFLNTFADELRDGRVLAHAVDLNPRKQGCFIAGTGQEVIAPARLRDVRPAVVLAMNPLYVEEIRASLGEFQVRAEVVVA